MARSQLERRLERLEERANPAPTECTCTHDLSKREGEFDASMYFFLADLAAHLLHVSVTELPGFDEELHSRGKTAAERPRCDFCESMSDGMTEQQLDRELLRIGLYLMPEPWRELFTEAHVMEKRQYD